MRRLFCACLVIASFSLAGCMEDAPDAIGGQMLLAAAGHDLVGDDKAEVEDRRRREVRKREERLEKLEKRYAKQLDACQEGKRRSCDDARDTYAEMQQLIPTIPAKTGAT